MAQEEKTADTREGSSEARYDAHRIEAKWLERWQQDPSLYAAEPHSTRQKYYVLEMLPYPSGALHMGHIRPQLLHRRCPRALHVDERLQRAPSHGLGFVRIAGRECGHPEQHASREWTLRNIAP